MLTPEAINKYKKIYKAEFGVDLTFEEAVEQAERFLNLVRIVMQPMPKRLLPRYKELQKQQSTSPSAQA